MSKLAVVMGRNYSARLGMIRAAGTAGYRAVDVQTVPAGRDGKLQMISASSKYADRAYAVPQTTHEELIDAVLKVTPEADGSVILLPTDDFSAAAIDTQQDRLAGKYLFPHIQGGKGKIVEFMDKKIQKELARKAGLNTVDTWELISRNGRYEIPEDISYPVFIKPQVSFQGAKSIMQRCSSREELEKVLGKIEKNTQYPILVEQFAEIEKEYDVPGFACGDIICTPGMIEKEIIHLGVTATGTIYPMSGYAGMEEKIAAFMRQFGFTGLFDLEMYMSRGKIYFNELNLRFGATGYAMTASGVNMPGMLADALTGGKVPETPEQIETRSFMSEKTCLENYSIGGTKWETYKKRLEAADIHFIFDEDDKAPWSYFKRRQNILLLKKTVKKFIKQ